jgi:hypothetical protein
MYYIRASEGNRATTTEALRKFYEHDKYKRLLSDCTIPDLLSLLEFWESVFDQDENRFSDDVLKKLFVLKYAPNGMWEYITSVYFLSFRDNDDNLSDAEFNAFLSKITAFIFAYALTNPGVNALRTPVYAEMIKLYNKQQCDFSEFRFSREHIIKVLDNYKFTNSRAVTRSILTWYAFTFENQERPNISTGFDIEHIYGRERHNKENKLLNPDNLEDLGNKILLEKSINIRASDYRFSDKKRYYNGYTDSKGRVHSKSIIAEFDALIQKDDFTEDDILFRDKAIQEKFVSYLETEGLLRD